MQGKISLHTYIQVRAHTHTQYERAAKLYELESKSSHRLTTSKYEVVLWCNAVVPHSRTWREPTSAAVHTQTNSRATCLSVSNLLTGWDKVWAVYGEVRKTQRARVSGVVVCGRHFNSQLCSVSQLISWVCCRDEAEVFFHLSLTRAHTHAHAHTACLAEEEVEKWSV